MAPDFAACGKEFTAHWNTTYKQYSYNGTISGVLKEGDRPALITIEGCLELCGHGYQLYSSSVWTNTVTTWVLPVVGGLLLQAPFESNRFWPTVFATTRWLGSPISSLSYVFWNIKVLGKCALMVDMATTRDLYTNSSSEFARLRDSFYILSVMNQFNIPPILPNMSAERLLRIALFSDTLELPNPDGSTQARLPELREALAADLRSRRRRGTVPVFVSLGWFTVSLAISINTAFGELGANATAHNLAMGLMLSWFPVFILACIVDRNPVNSKRVQHSLNEFLKTAREALLESRCQNTYLQDGSDPRNQIEWIQDLRQNEELFKYFFLDFAGQGRIRWHYGVAHPILAGIEDIGVAGFGRNWFRGMENLHDNLVLGPRHALGLHFFDWRELWQILSSVFIVFGTLLGAFIISIYTPTVGLGCRSGGYMIFFILTLSSFIIEMMAWLTVSTQYEGTEAIHIASKDQADFQSKVDKFVFKPFDVINTGWLVYIVCAQTFGTYQTCQCVGSTWGLGLNGGYIDFLSVLDYKAKGIALYWWAGTSVSVAFLSVASIYIFAEWLSQSHLSTENYEKAMRGLNRTRTWKHRTSWFRALPDLIVRVANKLSWWGRGLRKGKASVERHTRRTLVWSAEPKERQSDEQPLTETQIRNYSPSPGRPSGDNNTVP